MTPEGVLALAGVLAAVVFNYFPGLSTWFEEKGKSYKQLFMLLLMAVLVGVMFLLSWLKLETFFTPDMMGGYAALKLFGAAVVGNVVAYNAVKYIGKKPTE